MGNSSSINKKKLHSRQFEIILDRLSSSLLISKLSAIIKEDQELLIEYAQHGKFRIYSTNIDRKTMKMIKINCKYYVPLLQDRFWCQHFERIPIEQWDWLFAFNKWLQSTKLKDLQRDHEKPLDMFMKVCINGKKRKKLLGPILSKNALLHNAPDLQLILSQYENSQNNQKCSTFYQFSKLPKELQVMVLKKVYKNGDVERGKFLWESTESKYESSALLPLRCLSKRFKSLVDVELRLNPIKKDLGVLIFGLIDDSIDLRLRNPYNSSKDKNTWMKVDMEMIEEYGWLTRYDERLLICFDLENDSTFSMLDNGVQELKEVWRKKIETSFLIVEKLLQSSIKKIYVFYLHLQPEDVLDEIIENL